MKKNLVVLTVGLILIAAFIPAVYFYSQFKKTQKLLENPTEARKLELNDILQEVGKLIDLPKGEEPTLATVSNKDRLKNQPFFSKAENGDRLLIFPKAKKAILYRPSTSKIIEVGPVSIGSDQQTATSSALSLQTKSVRVTIYNGSSIAGLASSTEARLKNKFKNISIVEKSNSRVDYEKSLVIDLTGKQGKLAAELAEYLGAEVGPLSAQEIRPQADILVIVAQ